MKFSATEIEALLSPITANVLFVDPETDPDQPSVLSFSRPVEPGFEDSAYYFEINDQSYGSYEGLEFVKLSRNKLEIKLEDWVLEKFGEPDFAEVTVEFEADDAKFQALLEVMRRIFKGFEDIYQEL